MFILDNRTLLVVIGMIAIGSAIILTFLWRSQKQRNGIGYWAAGMMTLAIATLLVSLRDIEPGLSSPIFSNLCYVFGFQLILRGIRIFTERPPLLFFDYGSLPIATCLFYYFYYVDNNQSVRIVVFSAAIVLVCIAIIVTLLTDHNKAQRSAGHAVAIVFGLFAFLNFMRGLMTLLFPSEQSIIENSLSTTLLYLSGIFFVGGMAMTLILQMYSILELRLRTVSLAVEQSASSIVITDNSGNIEYINPAALHLSGYVKDELIGKDPSVFRSNKLSPDVYEEMWRQLREGNTWRGEFHNVKKNGEGYWEVASIAPVKQANGKISHFVAVKEDITSIKEAKQKIHHLAHHDSLTGLPTRALMMERLKAAIAEAEERGWQVAVLFIDIDGFKDVNDTFGHAIGDKLLKQLTQNLCACVRDTDTVARIGGDEFIVVLEHVSDHVAITVIAERMIKAVSEAFEIDGIEVNVSASIGIALYPQNATDPHDLIKMADHAMYEVKRTGKNNFAFASKEKVV